MLFQDWYVTAIEERSMQKEHEVAVSYEYCRNLTKAAARNFYYGFALLPPAKRDALCALYAFMRRADDISDSSAQLPEKQASLKNWRTSLDDALAGNYKGNPIFPAFHHTVERYEIPSSYFHDLLAGAEMDLSVDRYETFDCLGRYCYCVAGTVGLCCVRVFGYTDPVALELAPRLGIAFQLTNILRDVREDFGMGRVYLPQEDLERFGCAEKSLGEPAATPEFVSVMKFEVERAWKFYEEGAQLQNLIHSDSQAALWTLTRIYSGVLRKVETIDYDVLAKPRPGLSGIEKAWIMLRAGAGFWKPGLCPRKT
jgi:15-cis-phytoene synthase